MQFIFRLRWRLLALTLIIAIPAFILIYVANVELHDSAAQAVKNDALGFAHVVGSGQDRIVAETQALLTTLARIPQLGVDQPQECNALLSKFRKDIPYNFIGL